MRHVAVDPQIFRMKRFHQVLKRDQAWADDFHDVIDAAARGDAFRDLVLAVDKCLETVEISLSVAAQGHRHNHLGKIRQLPQRDIGMVTSDEPRSF